MLLFSALVHRQIEYGYDVFPTKGSEWYEKTSWKSDEVIEFFEEARDELFDQKKLKYDGAIIIYGGHGLNGAIITSDAVAVQIEEIHLKYSGAWKAKITYIPRFFIFDCCRGFTDSGKVTKKDRGNSLAHRADLISTLYGNSPGIKVSESMLGGYFSQCLIECLRKNKNNPRFTVTKLAITLNKELQNKTGHAQICWKEGDARVDERVFNAAKTMKSLKIPNSNKKVSSLYRSKTDISESMRGSEAKEDNEQNMNEVAAKNEAEMMYWDEDDVVVYMSYLSRRHGDIPSGVANKFEDAEIDGYKLWNLTKKDLKNKVGVTDKDAKAHIFEELCQIREGEIVLLSIVDYKPKIKKWDDGLPDCAL